MSENDSDIDLLYGYSAIGKAIGIKPNQARHLARSQSLPVFKIGRLVCSRRSDLKRWLEKYKAAASKPDL